MNTAKPHIHYAWVILVISFLMVGCALGFCSGTAGLYLAAITQDLGLPRGLYAISSSCRYVATAVINLFFGRLILKFGPRKLAVMGFGFLAASTLVNSMAQSLWAFYLGGALLGLGLAWTTTTLVGYVVERWFTSKKGTIMGIILASNGVTGALATQILTPIIYGASDGWRSAYRLASVLMLVIGTLVALLFRSDPKELGQEPLGAGQTAKQARGKEWAGISTADAVRKPWFYLCLVCVFLTGMLLQSITGVASAHMLDRGISPAVMAAAVSVHSIVLTLSKMYTGFSFDRFGLRITMLWCSICAVAGIAMLALVSSGPMAFAAEILTSFALPLETIMLPLIAKDLFGQRDYPTLMGLLVSCNTLGFAVGTPLMNLFFDLTGSYTNVMLVLCAVMIAAAVTMQLVITAAHKAAKQ